VIIYITEFADLKKVVKILNVALIVNAHAMELSIMLFVFKHVEFVIMLKLFTHIIAKT
jgi:hypothetical protein